MPIKSRLARTSLTLLTAAALAVSSIGCATQSHANPTESTGIEMPFQEDGRLQANPYFSHYPVSSDKETLDRYIAWEANYDGDNLMKENNPQAALEEYLTAVNLQPSVAHFRFDYAFALERTGNPKAAGEYQSAIDWAKKQYIPSGNPILEERGKKIIKWSKEGLKRIDSKQIH